MSAVASVARHAGPDLVSLDRVVLPQFRPLLARPELMPRWRGVSVGYLGQLFGAALAVIDDEKANAEVVSLFVRSEWRRRGVATDLVAGLEDWLREEGLATVHWTGDAGTPNLPIVHRILDHRGWQSPRPGCLLAVSVKPDNPQRLVTSRWVTHRRIPAGVTLGRWSDIPPAELRRLAERANDSEFFADVSCDGSSIPIDPQISVPAFADDAGTRRLVGWMTVEAAAGPCRRYLTLFVEEEFRKTGLGVTLLAEAMARHNVLHGTKPGFGIYCTMRPDGDGMRRLFERRLKPFTDHFVEQFEREKALIDAPCATHVPER